MIFQQQLRIPGPAPLPERVVRAASKPMIDHRGPEFAALLKDILAGVKRVFETQNDAILLSSSGSGGLESAVANLVSPGDKALCCFGRNFGERFAGMAAPRLAFVSVSERAWAQAQRARAPRFYFDWASLKKSHAEGSTPFTPAISVCYALQEGLRLLEEESIQNVYARHRRLADATAAALEAMGFPLFAAEGYRSPVVTGALPMPGLDVNSYRRLLRERYGLVI